MSGTEVGLKTADRARCVRLTLRAMAVAIATLGLVGALAAGEAQPKRPSWQIPKVEHVRSQVLQWLGEGEADDKSRAAVLALWPSEEQDLAGPEMLARLVRSFALVEPRAAQLADLCARPKAGPALLEQSWLREPSTPPWLAHNLRLYYGRWLVHESLVDEALEQLAGLETEQVVDPASLLFYQAVVHYHLLDQEAGMKAIEQLLEEASQSPKRYAAVARLMREELRGLKEDSLDHIARRMEDIRRRLELGRAGPKVRSVEDGVIESLDKLIKKVEQQQQQQQQQQASSGGGNMQPNSPAPDSQILGGRGRGDVARKDIGHESGWGNLPPKERDEALQTIGRDFPTHYRDVIEQYFRRLAGESSE